MILDWIDALSYSVLVVGGRWEGGIPQFWLRVSRVHLLERDFIKKN